jgi:hypothetical protein
MRFRAENSTSLPVGASIEVAAVFFAVPQIL